METNSQSQRVINSLNDESLFEKIVQIDGQLLTAKYIKTLSYDEREKLIHPLFDYFRKTGWIYPDNTKELDTEYKKLCKYNPDLSNMELNNNTSLGTKICKFFCHNFYLTSEKNCKNMLEVFHNDELLIKLIKNRLGFDWKDNPINNETFNISYRMLVQGLRSSRLASSISMFKPSIAKYLCLKYSSENDIIYDYSAGWGGRLLGSTSCNRQYIGVDPLTSNDLSIMAKYLNIKNITLINDGSENIRLAKNSIDFSFSSPPYYDQEIYSSDISQAYNKNEDHFYNVYWNNTLDNVQHMLKPQKIFALNVKNYPRMLIMAQDKFGPIIEEIKLKTLRSHLNRQSGMIKYESIYIFRNNK